MALLPQMLQSIEVLQLATADLVAFVDAELQQNETLEVERREVEAPEQQEATSVERDEPSYEEFRRASADGEDKKLGFLNSVPDRKVSAVDQVREQLAFREVPPLLAEVVVLLTERLDERGLLPQSDAELAEEAPSGRAADRGCPRCADAAGRLDDGRWRSRRLPRNPHGARPRSRSDPATRRHLPGGRAAREVGGRARADG